MCAVPWFPRQIWSLRLEWWLRHRGLYGPHRANDRHPLHSAHDGFAEATKDLHRLLDPGLWSEWMRARGGVAVPSIRWPAQCPDKGSSDAYRLPRLGFGGNLAPECRFTERLPGLGPQRHGESALSRILTVRGTRVCRGLWDHVRRCTRPGQDVQAPVEQGHESHDGGHHGRVSTSLGLLRPADSLAPGDRVERRRGGDQFLERRRLLPLRPPRKQPLIPSSLSCEREDEKGAVIRWCGRAGPAPASVPSCAVSEQVAPIVSDNPERAVGLAVTGALAATPAF